MLTNTVKNILIFKRKKTSTISYSSFRVSDIRYWFLMVLLMLRLRSLKRLARRISSPKIRRLRRPIRRRERPWELRRPNPESSERPIHRRPSAPPGSRPPPAQQRRQRVAEFQHWVRPSLPRQVGTDQSDSTLQSEAVAERRRPQSPWPSPAL